MSFFKLTIIGILAGFCNGLFGSGGGTILVPAMVFLLAIKENKAHATAITVILPLSLISIGFYFFSKNINWSLALYVAIGSTLGGYLGSRVLNKFSDCTLRRIFGLSMIIAGIRLVI